ncbi:type II and III secretion system protein family protein [Aporhodopirellula aestuarii]|uniref:Pilus assembly protein N-terminal domain-containing protein n=1 Tax=Aporhodopirellula aestuarii TaxID=2950107 RepID=A0ABT0U8R5_9BACT|nr:pilus assembly protein N-terminal domain-containing protein [Aporhodopirellula aestuarii]MCM2372803.1 pilus assembly protein N-terminal domain-containing protein [Aporhodopirellula aestuarii]
MRACYSILSLRSLVAFTAMVAYGSMAMPALRPACAQSTLASVSGDHKIANTVERMELIVKTSRILSLGDRIPRFQVHNEEVLGATPVSENQIQIFAKNPGTTQVNLWDTEDKLYTIDVTIVADAREVEGILNSQLPLASLRVMPINESAIVSGFVTSVDDVERAISIIEQFYKVVINNIEVVGVQQVLLHTRIMEVSRTKLRQLGIDWSLAPGNFTLLNGPGELLNVPAGLVEGDSGILGFTPFGSATNLRLNVNGDFEAFVEALDEQKLVKLLAEPTVVATHGRPARFIVGGRVPNVVPGNNGQLQVEYEDYGTSIDFLPFVIGPGRIRLEVRPEVSEPDPTNAVTIGSTNVAAFTTRYVETAVEMQAGETFAIAGLLQSRVESVVKRTPYLGHIPLLGALFRNTQNKHNEIELLIMVTPELVAAMAPHEVPPGGPGLNSDIPDDYEFYINGHIEVPNLKSDQCFQEGGGCPPSEAAYQQGGVIIQDGFSMNNNGGGPATKQDKPAPRLTQSTPTHQMPQQVRSEMGGYQGPSLIEPAATIAAAPRGSVPASYTQPTGASRFESGALLPAGAVTPSSEPKSVGQGVSVSTPVYR